MCAIHFLLFFILSYNLSVSEQHKIFFPFSLLYASPNFIPFIPFLSLSFFIHSHILALSSFSDIPHFLTLSHFLRHSFSHDFLSSIHLSHTLILWAGEGWPSFLSISEGRPLREHTEPCRHSEGGGTHFEENFGRCCWVFSLLNSHFVMTFSFCLQWWHTESHSSERGGRRNSCIHIWPLSPKAGGKGRRKRHLVAVSPTREPPVSLWLGRKEKALLTKWKGQARKSGWWRRGKEERREGERKEKRGEGGTLLWASRVSNLLCVYTSDTMLNLVVRQKSSLYIHLHSSPKTFSGVVVTCIFLSFSAIFQSFSHSEGGKNILHLFSFLFILS